MNRKAIKLSQAVRLALALTLLLVVAVFAAWAAPRVHSQTNEPYTVEADIPFELRAPWFNPERTEVLDEVLLRGRLHVTTRTWASSATKIDRFALHANAVDIHGTSETTGQRYRLNGSFSFDLRDPEVTFNPDGTFNVPMQQWELRLHFVDPGPARLTAPLSGSISATGASYYIPPPPPVPCQRVLAPDGSPTVSLNCGNVVVSYFLTPIPHTYRVLASGGDACVPGQNCVVPDGATLFNGYTGGYKAPLLMRARVSTNFDSGFPISPKSGKWHCKTGDKEAPVSSFIGPNLLIMGNCRPIYSATEPIKVWAEITYRYYRYVSSEQPSQEVTFVVTEKPFTFYMNERPVDQPPVIQTFSVQAESRATGRCAPGQLCELADGDILFNQQAGDYNSPLYMRLTASDPEGDPIIVQWYCKSGSNFVPITDLGFGQYRCSPSYIFPDPILIYASVSDGNNVVWSQQRQLYMLEFVH